MFHLISREPRKFHARKAMFVCTAPKPVSRPNTTPIMTHWNDGKRIFCIVPGTANGAPVSAE